MHYGKKGFTLVEMIIVMAMFMLVIMAASSSFNVLLTQMTKLTKTEESNIEGVVGLEMLRHDLQQAGFGLPDAYMDDAPPNYVEASIAPADDYNDAPSGLPKAVVAANNLLAGVEVADAVDGVTYELLAGTDYLALKGTTLGMNETAQKWTYMPFNTVPHLWADAHLNLEENNKVVVIRRRFVGEKEVKMQMIYTDPDNYSTDFNPAGLDPAFKPTLPEEVFYIYGIHPGGNLSMPFNRSDYFVARPDVSDRMPLYCAPNTGILYKARVTHDETASTGYASGALQPMPLLDCVADMQVVFGWDLDGDTNIDTWSTPTSAPAGGGAFADYNTSLAGLLSTELSATLGSPDLLHNRLKVIKIYLLAQVGRRDPSYQRPTASIMVGNPADDSITVSKSYTLTAAMRSYRWKVYQLVVRPQNLVSNQ
jgi:prepilin-type N-terminal cleavage/methylation domain-containing protein